MGQSRSPATTFSKDRQPASRGKNGRKNYKEIRKLINAFGNAVAPKSLFDDEKVKQFLDANNLGGTYNEVLIARLYSMALRTKSLKDLTKAVETIVKISSDNKKEVNKGIIINFISPPSIEQEKSIVLENDSFTVLPPVEESED